MPAEQKTGIPVVKHQGDCCWTLPCREILPGEPAVSMRLTQIPPQKIVIAPVDATLLSMRMVTKHDPEGAALH